MAWEKLESDFPSPGPAFPSQGLCVPGDPVAKHKPGSLGTLGAGRRANGGKEEEKLEDALGTQLA